MSCQTMNYSESDMIRRFVAGAFLIFGSVPCVAATDLGITWSNLPISLNIAASRVGGDPLASNGSCDQGRSDPCRWTGPGGIDFTAESDGSGHLQKIEADWNNDDHPGQAAAFRSACAAIAALVQPRWGKPQAIAAVSRTMALTGAHGTVAERQQVIGGIRLFGDRNAPSQPSGPDSAFLQCGAAPDY